MKFTQSFVFFIFACVLNFILIYLFALNLYIFYFLALVFFMNILYRYYRFFSHVVFFSFFLLIIIVTNLDAYAEYSFEFLLFFNLLDHNIYINSAVMYILTVVHLVLLSNLKKFEFFWDIIDKKLFRN